MGVDTLHSHFHTIGRERFGIDFVPPGTIKRITDQRPQFGQINLVSTPANLFITGEAEPYHPMLQLIAMTHQLGSGGHDRGDPGFIIGTQQRGSVRGNHRIPHTPLEIGIFRDPNHLRGIAGQRQILSLIIRMHDRIDVLRRILG